MTTVTITAGPLSLEDLLAVTRGARIELGLEARARIATSRAVVDTAVARGDPIYGLTTGVGHGKDTSLSADEISAQQQMLVMTHAGGVGPPLSTELVRAALAVRLNGIARGGSGASLAAAEVLAAMLNARVHPVVPATSSVGAGDLGAMAAIAQVAVGMGRAEHDGVVSSGADALEHTGITPLELGPKDGLALISASAVSIGHAAVVVARAAETAADADVSLALSMEAVGANPSIIHPAVGRAKGLDGQTAAADHLREVLAGSGVFAHEVARSVQDALSFRVAPQVHGALREYVATARRAVETELNAANDNPLVSVADQTLISNGNFHPMVLAIAFDALRVAIAHVGQISERRMSHLWDAFFGRLAEGGVPSTGGGPPQLVGLALRYPAAAVISELTQLAAPATLDTPPLDIGVEDHATGAPLSVRKTHEALDLLDDILAIEVLLAGDVLRALPSLPSLGGGTTPVMAMATELVTAPGRRSPDDIHRALRAGFPRH
ncbi:MAG TPA: aromatic amino acid ammonia-lyase [Euzebyales bacterium]